jgi:hypothetical protein
MTTSAGASGVPRVYRPHECGWMRRGDLEDAREREMHAEAAEKSRRIEIWEQPDGKLLMHDRSAGPLRLARQSDLTAYRRGSRADGR